MNFLGVLVYILVLILGGLPTVFLVVGLPVVIIYKFYRKVRFQEKIMG